MLDDLITSKTRKKILHIFLDNPDEMHYVRSLVRKTGEEINSVRRELSILKKIGILTSEKRANRVYYLLDKTYPFYQDLIKIYAKMVGLGAEIIKNRVKLGKIKYAMLSGKFVNRIPVGPDEVDLMIVGNVVLPEVALLVRNEEARIGREINYTVMVEEEFAFRKKRKDPFLSSIIYGPRVMLLGDELSMLK